MGGHLWGKVDKTGIEAYGGLHGRLDRRGGGAGATGDRESLGGGICGLCAQIPRATGAAMARPLAAWALLAGRARGGVGSSIPFCRSAAWRAQCLALRRGTVVGAGERSDGTERSGEPTRVCFGSEAAAICCWGAGADYGGVICWQGGTLCRRRRR